MTRAKTLGEWLSTAYQESGLCPPPESLLAAEKQGLESETLAKLELHISACPACAAEQDLARIFDQVDGSVAEGGDVNWVVRELSGSSLQGTVVPMGEKRSDRWTRLAIPLALAATALIAVGLLIQVNRQTPPPLPEVPDSTVTRSMTIEIVEPHGEMDSAPSRLVWVDVTAASTYEVILARGDGTEIWRDEFKGSPAVLPEEVRSRLQPAVVYSWSVQAADATGRVVGRSAAASIRVQLSKED